MFSMYGCESWTTKKTERQIIDARRFNQSILKKISHGHSLEGLMLKLKLQYFAHLMQRNDSLEKILMLERSKAGVEWDDRGWDEWMVSPTQWTWVWVSSGSWWWTGNPGVLQSMELQRVGHNWVTELKNIYEEALGLKHEKKQGNFKEIYENFNCRDIIMKVEMDK